MIDCVVAPVDQTFPIAEDEVSVTLPPVQKVAVPEVEIVGIDGIAFTVTTVSADEADEQPFAVTATE